VSISCLFSIQSRYSDNYSFPSTKWSETCTTTLILLTSVSFGTIWGGGCNMHFCQRFLWCWYKRIPRYGYCWPVKINGLRTGTCTFRRDSPSHAAIIGPHRDTATSCDMSMTTWRHVYLLTWITSSNCSSQSPFISRRLLQDKDGKSPNCATDSCVHADWSFRSKCRRRMSQHVG